MHTGHCEMFRFSFLPYASSLLCFNIVEPLCLPQITESYYRKKISLVSALFDSSTNKYFFIPVCMKQMCCRVVNFSKVLFPKLF